MPQPKISICVPVFNEAENLPLLHQAIVAVVDPDKIDAEIILVDDGSTDGSWQAIQALVAKDPRVRGLKFRKSIAAKPPPATPASAPLAGNMS